MQDVDRILAEVATHAAAAGLTWKAGREVLLANMLGEQPLPIDFRDSRRLNPKPRRCASSQSRLRARRGPGFLAVALPRHQK